MRRIEIEREIRLIVMSPLMLQVSDEIKFEKSDLEEDRHKALDFLFPQGQKVWVKVTAIEQDQRGGSDVRVNGSMRAVSQSDGGDLDPSGRLTAGVN